MDREKIICESIDATRPLEEIITPNTEVRISNVVGKVDLLDNKKKSLDLQAIALYLRGYCKYQPRNFAAAVLHLKDRVGATTCLVFNSGKLVIVGAETKHHSLWASQMYRREIERVPMVFRKPRPQEEPSAGDSGAHLVCTNLTGRTIFSNWWISNFVGYSYLGYRPDLKQIALLTADLSNWNSALFPGLPLRIWLRPRDDCKCPRKKKNKPCKCQATALLFDSGKIVITGCTYLEDINKTHYLLHQFLSDESLHEKSGQLPRNMRFEERRKKNIGLTIEIDPAVVEKLSIPVNMLETLLKDCKPIKRI